MDQLRKERLELAAQAKGITDAARTAVRALSDDEKKSLDSILARVANIDTEIKAAEENEARVNAINAMFAGDAGERVEGGAKGGEAVEAKTVGEHFVKHMQAAGIKSLRRGLEFGAPEVKAATDTHVTGGPAGFYEPWLVDRQLSGGVRPVRENPVVGDLISWGSTNAQMIEYLEYPANMLEGSAGFVNEGGSKPQVHIKEPVWRNDPVREVAVHWRMTDDMAEDLAFVVSEINDQLVYNFADVEASAILRGNGTAPNLLGILNRSGIQHAKAGANPAEMADNLFKALQSVQTASGTPADGIVINPVDYQNLRLMKDSNGQYFAGGIFNTNYGSQGLQWQPPLWGVKTVVSNSAEVGKPIVGAWKLAKGYRKGGLKVESTNSHLDDFTNDRITLRMREKIGLAVRRPSGFVVLDLPNA